MGQNEQHSHLSHSHLGGSRQLEKADRAATASHSVLRLRCQNWCWGAWGSAQEGVDMLERGWREPTFEDEQMQKRSPPASSPPPPRLALQKRSGVSQVFSGGSPLAKRSHSSTGRASKQWTDAFYRGRRSSRIQVSDAGPGTYYLLLECRQKLNNLGLTLTLGDTDYLRRMEEL